MSRDPFGYVADTDRLAAGHAPPFTQEQVDYLRKQFLSGGCTPATSLDEAVRVLSWVGVDAGQRQLIDHLQSIVDARAPNQVTV